MRRIVAAGGTVLALGGLTLAGLTLRAGQRAPGPVDAPDRPPPAVDGERVAEALAAYLRIDTQRPAGPDSWPVRTVVVDDTTEPPTVRSRPAWIAHLEDGWTTPLGLRTARLGEGFAVFVDTPDPRPPVLWLSHVDVVPVDAEDWTVPPFEGRIDDTWVWGRGALDNKASTICQLEALRLLTEAGLTPSRDLVLLVTPDEETSGATAQAAAADLAALGNPEVVIDEGSYVLPDFLSDLTVAAVAVAEKTYVSYDLTVRVDGGHSSMPRGASSIDVLTAALQRIATWETEDGLTDVFVEAFRRLGPHRAYPESIALGNADLLGPVLLPIVQRTAAGNAVTRDTIAATIVQAGVKDNVIPTTARATLNARLLPTTDPEDFLARLTARVADERVVIEASAWPANAGISRWDTPTFEAVERSVHAILPDAVVIPSLTPGTMDARYFAAQGLTAYRFHPFVVDAEERARIHGVDERIHRDDLTRGVQFYWSLAQAL